MRPAVHRPDGFSPATSKRTPARASARPSARAQADQRAATARRRQAEKSEFRRFTARTRRRHLVWGVSLGSIGLLIAGVTVLTLSPVLALRQVNVEGATRVSIAEVETALQGLYGEPLARVSNDRVKAALEPLTLIQAFETRIEPPGTLVVTIVERRPLGVVSRSSGFDVIDAAGVTLWSESVAPLDLPSILVPANPDEPSFRAISRVLLALPPEVLMEVAGVNATTLDDVRFTMRTSEHEVVWGSPERAREKARVLAASLVTAGRGVPKVIDVTTPDSVVIRSQQ